MQTHKKTTYQVDLEPVGKRVMLGHGQTLVDAALLGGLDLITSCNGLGICGSCKIRLLAGNLSPLSAEEYEKLSSTERKEGFRLACQAEPNSDVRIYIPAGSLTQGQQLQVDGVQGQLTHLPLISALDVTLPQPSQTDLRSDLQRVQDSCLVNGIELNDVPLTLLQNLPLLIRENHWEVRLVIFKNEKRTRLAAILPHGSPYFGLALDIGSTKIAAYWVDLASGAILEQSGFINPQISFGEDVVNRIAYANLGMDQQRKLQQILIATLNQYIEESCQKLEIQPEQIVDMTVVGNTAIHHLFCGLPVRSLGEAPYVAVVTEALYLLAEQINIRAAPGCLIFLPPNIAGYVGADHTAALIATRFYESQQTLCLIDIGTNTEISLIRAGKIRSCSCASGPAFEGAHIYDGMRAAPGAIEQVRINGQEVTVHTIAQRPAVGICGSGILSAAAELRRNKIIDQRGVFDKKHPLVKEEDRQSYCVLAESQQGDSVHNIRVTRHDINEIQLAKGAIRAGIEILLKDAGITAQQVDHYLIAGAFGTHLDLQSAIEIGMFPDVALDKYQQIGNAAGVGARELLVNETQRRTATQIVKNVEYIELTSEPTFSDTYVVALHLEKNDSLFTEI